LRYRTKTSPVAVVGSSTGCSALRRDRALGVPIETPSNTRVTRLGAFASTTTTNGTRSPACASWRAISQWTGPSGHVYATDIGEEQLAILRAVAVREGLSNVTVIAGAAASTNLPAGCCDAILLRNVFHYLTEPAAMIRSLAASLKPGGRLAIVDFPPRPNTTAPPGVPANRGGQGVPPDVVEREVGVLFRHVTTVPNWAPEGVPSWVPPEIAPSFVAIFEKTR